MNYCIKPLKMNNPLLIFLLADILLALLIAQYQKQKGYKFVNTFISALIGLIGLSALVYKAFFL